MEKNRGPQNRHTNTVNWSLTKKQEQFSGEMIDFSTNGIVTTGYPQAKKKKEEEESRHWPYTFCKKTQNGS